MLALRDVSKTIGEQEILRHVDLDLAAGETVLVKGPSGSGKTTLLRILGLIDAPTSGQVLFHDANVAYLPDADRSSIRRDNIGFVFQSHNMIPDLTILENVLVPMRLRGRPNAARARSLLGAVGVQDRADRLPSQVSVGERQRAAFARALANDPGILLADEPTASVDAERAEAVVDVLLDLTKSGKTIVVASHDPRIWDRLTAARTFVMSRGHLVPEGDA